MRILAKSVGFWDGALVHPGEELELPDGSPVPAWAVDLATIGSPAEKPAPPKVHDPMTLRQMREKPITSDEYFQVKAPKRKPAEPFVDRK